MPEPQISAQIPLKNILAPREPWLKKLGDGMVKYRSLILATQWTVVAVYAFLVIAPALMPLPAEDEHLWNNLTRFAQFAFWGIWWPFVMVSMMLMGRVWCGVFCPEGAVSEFASRRGLGLKIPRWLRWGGWPFVSFSLTTLIGQLTSIYEYPKPVLLILGGSSIAALVIGFLYGRGVRVWCRYLCPANGVFALLARLAPVHFKVSEEVWQQSARVPAVDCPPLLDVKHQAGSGACHSCGRCSGHRDAVALTPRSMLTGVTELSSEKGMNWEAVTLLFGLLGVALAAFQWSISPYYVQMNNALAGLAIDKDWMWVFESNAPWWLLTHYPEVGDAFSWLDGFSIFLYIVLAALGFGLVQWGILALARWASGTVPFWHLALALTPMGGISVFLGLSMLTLNQLRQDGILLPYLPQTRALLLVLALLWSGLLLWRLLKRYEVTWPRQVLTSIFFFATLAVPTLSWVGAFYFW